MPRYRQPEPPYTVDDGPPRVPLAKRLARFVALVGCVFAIATAVIVTQRLSRDSLALLIGLTCGVAAMLPTFVLGFLVWRRDDARRHAHPPEPRQLPQTATPPVIVVSPNALPARQQQPAFGQPQDWQWAGAESQRSFTIVGGEE